MATSRNNLKTYFETGKKPTQSEFGALIENLLHQEEDKVLSVLPIDTIQDSKFVTPKVAKMLIDKYSVSHVNGIGVETNGNIVITDIQGRNNTPLRYFDFRGYEAQWYSDNPMHLGNGEVFTTDMSILIHGLNRLNLITHLTHTDETDPYILFNFSTWIYRHATDLNRIYVRVILGESKSWNYFKTVSFATYYFEMPSGWIDVSVNIKVIDKAAGVYECSIVVNGKIYSVGNLNLVISLAQQVFTLQNYPSSNRICWGIYYPSMISMGNLKYSINGLEREFKMDSNGVIYSTNGIGMAMMPNHNNFVDKSVGAKLFIRPVNEALQEVTLEELYPQPDTSWIDLSNRLRQEWLLTGGTLHCRIQGKELHLKTSLLTHVGAGAIDTVSVLANLDNIIYTNVRLQNAPILFVNNGKTLPANLYFAIGQDLRLVVNSATDFSSASLPAQFFKFKLID